MSIVNYKDMSFLKEGQKGNFKLEKFEITGKEWRCNIPPGKYIRLRDTTEFYAGCIMSDTPMEKMTNASFLDKAHGDILIGGLGIGMIILPLLEKEEVKSITVFEKNQEIIDLILHQLPSNSKLTVINKDVFEKNTLKQKFDCIYMDIWNYINQDVYNEMKKLKTKYKKNLNSENPNSFIKCWAEYQAKRGLRL